MEFFGPAALVISVGGVIAFDVGLLLLKLVVAIFARFDST